MKNTHILFSLFYNYLSLIKDFPFISITGAWEQEPPLPLPNIKTPGTLIIKTSLSLSEDGSVQNMSVKIVQIHPINVFIWA